PGAYFAAAAGAGRIVAGDADLPQRAVAGAVVLLHAAAAVRVPDRQHDHPASRMAEVDLRARVARDGEYGRAGARRGALDPIRAMGGGGIARHDAPPNDVDGDPAAVCE